MKIYVVTEGIYSDYHICGATTDREEAEKIRKYVETDGYTQSVNIEEFDSDVWTEVLKVGGYYLVSEQKCGPLHAFKADCDIEEYYPKRSIVEETDDRLRVWVCARDRDHAKKIASDLFAKYKAEKEGL